ncbi:type II toxin-antitoxin system HipA family toxin [Photobacterium sp. J15]|uniref:type II toxin-antitoxin system HipA family toxin n=1 Tax=Photobacterium sp. J15 TaxID=265901 RepID=UPI0007E41F34|nr:type II toxin-antitoxin system HipA family toxin [Photobacterium sp. J15]
MKKLFTYMNNDLVGEFIKQSNGAHQFRYSPEWINSHRARALSLSLPLQYDKITSDSVINYFDNLLPDLPEVRAKIVARHHADSTQAFDLLSMIGRDSVGAITLLPPDAIQDVKKLEYEELSEERLERILSAYMSNAPLGMLEDDDEFRISVAGAQEKTALLRIGQTWCVPHGSTPTTHIIKLPIGEIRQPHATLDMKDSVENEFLCIELARELGFKVPEVEIVRAGKMKAIAVERFDRRWAKDSSWLIRLPQEDICQAQGKPSALKYESDGGASIKEIMALLMGSSNALQDRDDFMRFQVFQWIVGATDGHAKNFSIYLEQGGAYRLTPFYDILSAYPIVGGSGLNIRKLKLAMGLKASKGKKYQIDKIYARHFIATASDVGFSKERMSEILDDFVVALPAAIERLDKRLPENFPANIKKVIFEHSLARVKRLALG